MKYFFPFRLDAVNQCLWRGETRLSLKPKAFAVLAHLVQHAGRLVTQNELLECLWPNTFVQPEVLKSHILQIRAVLGDNFKHPTFIETLPRRGYRFIKEVTEPIPDFDVPVINRERELEKLHHNLSRIASDLEHALELLAKLSAGESAVGETRMCRNRWDERRTLRR